MTLRSQDMNNSTNHTNSITNSNKNNIDTTSTSTSVGLTTRPSGNSTNRNDMRNQRCVVPPVPTSEMAVSSFSSNTLSVTFVGMANGKNIIIYLFILRSKSLN